MQCTNLLTKLSICVGKLDENRHPVVCADLKLLLFHRASTACDIITHVIITARSSNFETYLYHLLIQCAAIKKTPLQNLQYLQKLRNIFV